MTDWGGLIQAGLGAYQGYQSAQQANTPRTTQTNQTTSQNPYAAGLINPDIQSAIDLQRQLMARGPAQIGGPGGQVSYGWDAGSSTGGGGAAPPPGGTRTNARGQQVPIRNQGGGGGRHGGGGGGGNQQPGGPNLNTASGISAAVAAAGLHAGNDPTTQAAQHGVQNILSGQGGADSGGTGFQGYNPINDALAQRLQGSDYDAEGLVRQFIGGDAAGNGGSGGYDPHDPYSVRPSGGYQIVNYGGGGGNIGGGGNGSVSSTVPDTVGGSNSYFSTQLQHMMDEGANNADLQTLIDAQNADLNRGMTGDLWNLDAQSQGTGRFGGDMWRGLGNDTRRNTAQAMVNSAATTRLTDAQQRRQMRENLLGQVNQRDLGAMQDATQRYGYDSSARAAGAGAAANAAATTRAQNLQALGMIMNNQQFNTGQLSGLGGQLSGDQLNAIGQAPGLAGINLAGLGQANNAAGTLASIQNAHTAASAQRGIANQQMQQQAQMWNAGQGQGMVNDYMHTIMGIGGMGGTSNTQGTNVVPGLGVNPYGAALYNSGAAYSNYRGGG